MQDIGANDGSHSEEIPILAGNRTTVVGVIHLHWDRHRNLTFMHAKNSMLSPKLYDIPFRTQPWSQIVRDVIQ